MSDETFEYRGVELPYLTHLYNITYLTERRVEVPIATHWLRDRGQQRGLEVGNVLGHYEQRYHDVADRDEPQAWYQEQDYMNVDLFDLATNVPYDYYDWIVSLSTIEHTINPLRAIEILRYFAPAGLITFPTGVSGALDTWIQSDISALFSVVTLVRTVPGEWAQSASPQIEPYGPWANAVAFLEWNRS